MSDFVEVPLTRGLVALVDTADADAVLAQRWRAKRDGKNIYAVRGVKRPDGKWATQGLHAFLTGHSLTDHRNHDGLDNRRANLRPATAAQNGRNRGPNRNNTSGYKGVSWRRSRRRWHAQIKIDGRSCTIGYYLTAEDAAHAYDSAAQELHGEFAWLNFPGAVVPIPTD